MNMPLPCSYPTTTLILDDQWSFLESIKIAFSETNKCLHLTTDPHNALVSIHESDKISHIDFLKSDNAGDLKPDFSTIINIAKNPLRTKEISVLIVDYHMPGINGLDFCKQIKNSFCQKILLTASSDQTIAINAFNNGLINKYIQKQDKNIDKIILESINTATNIYLSNKFNLIVNYTNWNNLCNSNTNLKNIITNIMQEEEIS